MYTARTPILKCRAGEKRVLLYWRCVPSRMFYRQRSRWTAGGANIRHVGNRPADTDTTVGLQNKEKGQPRVIVCSIKGKGQNQQAC